MRYINFHSSVSIAISSIAFFGLITISTPAFGQKKKDKKESVDDDNDTNLVRNGSFEILKNSSKKPKKLGGIDMINGWHSPTAVKADAYRIDGDEKAGLKIPATKFACQEPTYGENYVGIHTYLTGKKPTERSYITGELKSKLTKNKMYCVEFWVSLAEGSKYACNNIGAAFDNKLRTEQEGEKQLFKAVADILHPDNKVFNSANGWHKICGTYTAKGGEQYITIGNFVLNNKTTSETNKKSKNCKATALQSAYYLIDNVTVREYFPTFEAYLIASNLPNLAKSDEELNEDEQAEKNEYKIKYDKITPCTCGGSQGNDQSYSSITFQKEFIIDEKWAPKQKIEAYSVFFGAGKSEITTEATATIDEISRILKANSSLSITIVGYADTMETKQSEYTPAYKDIDKKRAEAVQAELVKLGVKNSVAILTKGITEESDLVSGDEEEKELDWAKNRRVQFIVK
jgi:outer membrane protein OmpA-like peptidoglycan-associated protein